MANWAGFCLEFEVIDPTVAPSPDVAPASRPTRNKGAMIRRWAAACWFVGVGDGFERSKGRFC
jgi:hypothetical protein